MSTEKHAHSGSLPGILWDQLTQNSISKALIQSPVRFYGKFQKSAELKSLVGAHVGFCGCYGVGNVNEHLRVT
eukprot:6199752-Pleurochrysis_carterae.AAC.1